MRNGRQYGVPASQWIPLLERMAAELGRSSAAAAAPSAATPLVVAPKPGS